MARTLTFTGEMSWPLEDGKQAAKANVSISLAYTSSISTEKVFSGTVTDEAVALPMASAKFMMIRAKTEDISFKVNGGDQPIILKGDAGFFLVYNPDGAITALTVTVATSPASLEFYAFA